MVNKQLKQANNVKISLEKFTAELIRNKLGPIVEVPCSYLKNFLNYIWDTKKISIINPVNEAVAMGIASGEYLGSGKIPIVAVQNSGLMNTLNALTSLNQIYDIPIFMMVTWRGQRGMVKDAPEHDVTGRDLERVLKTFNLSYEIIDSLKFKKQIKDLSDIARVTGKPVVLVIKKDTFEKYVKQDNKVSNESGLSRLNAISIMKRIAKNKGIFVSSTGFPTRDSFGALNTPDFYMVGSMGHTFSTALGISTNTKKKVIVLDGDGSMFMHLGAMASFNPEIHKNIIYVILDNKSYESTGGQLTAFGDMDLLKLAKLFKFKSVCKVDSENKLKDIFKMAIEGNHSSFIQLSIRKGQSGASDRVTDFYTCREIKNRFSKAIKNSSKSF